jgi:glycosyltransferase involved in cell wall biosynthesis
MKIGIIVDSIDDGGMGIGTYTRNLVEKILELDKENEYVLIHHTKSDDPLYKKAKELIIPLKKIPFAREYRKIFQMPKILEKEKFDLVHETTQIGPFFRKSKFKKIVTIHDLSPLIFPKSANSSLAYWHHKFGLKIVLKNVDKVVAVSENTKNDVLKFFNISSNKIKMIYEAPHSRYHLNYSKEEIEDVLKKYNLTPPFFFYCGTLEPRKFNTNMVKAFAEISTDAKLVIGGKKGWKFKAIFEEIENSNAREKIILPGFIPDEDVPKLFMAAEAYVFPSFYEGFGIFVIEAMASGCPVITSNTSCLPEISGGAALLVNPQSVKEIADALVKVRDETLREKMISEGLKQAAKFSWEKAARETIELYQSLNSKVDGELNREV